MAVQMDEDWAESGALEPVWEVREGFLEEVMQETACGAGDSGSMATHSSILAWRIPWTE